MATKFLVWATIIAIAQAAMLPTSNTQPDRNREHDSRSQYTYDYNIQDPTTGGYKIQEKNREIDIVRGKYASVESSVPEHVGYKPVPIHAFSAIAVNTPTVAVAHGSSPITYESQAYPEYVGYSPYTYSPYSVHPAPYYTEYNQQVYY